MLDDKRNIKMTSKEKDKVRTV